MLKVGSLIKTLKSGEIKSLPSFTSIGGYPVYYITSYSRILCADCAQKLINDIYEDIVHYDINYENEIICDECSSFIDSAY